MAADGSIVFEVNIDDKHAEEKLNQLKNKIQRLQNSLEKSTGEQSGIKSKLDSAKAAAEQTEQEIKRIMDALKSELALNEDIASGKITLSDAEWQQAEDRQVQLIADLKEQQNLLKNQDREIESLGKQYDRVTKKIEDQTQELTRTKEEAAAYARQVIETSKNQDAMANMARKASDAMGKFTSRVKSLAKRILVFSLIAAALRSLKNLMWQAIEQSREASAAVAQLKGALLALAQPLIEVILPIFTAFVNILAKIVTAIAKFVSLLFGKSFSQTKQNAKALNAQAAGIKNVGKEAKEASKYLAGFDELNVMPEQDNDKSSGVGGGGIGPDFSNLDADISMFDNLLNRLKKIWQDIRAIFKDVKDIFVSFFTGDWGKMMDSIQNLFLHTRDLLSDILLLIRDGIGDAIDWVIEKFNLAETPIGDALEAIKDLVQGAIDFIVAYINFDLDGMIKSLTKFMSGAQNLVFSFIDFVKDGVDNLLTWLDQKTGGKFHDIIEVVKAHFRECFDYLKDISGSTIAGVKDSLVGILNMLGGVFTGNWKQVWMGLKQFVVGMSAQMAGSVGSALNVIIRALNWMIAQINRISITVPDWVPGIGGRTVGFNIPAISEIQIPRLAQGAVIPPNREFMAVLGDQKRGTNIEAPADLIRQIVREELNSSGGGEEITIKFTGDLAQLARVLSPEITRQQRRSQRAMGV